MTTVVELMPRNPNLIHVFRTLLVSVIIILFPIIPSKLEIIIVITIIEALASWSLLPECHGLTQLHGCTSNVLKGYLKLVIFQG